MHYELIKQSSIKNIIFYNAGATFLKCVHASHFLLNAGIGEARVAREAEGIHLCSRDPASALSKRAEVKKKKKKGRGDPQGSHRVTEKVKHCFKAYELAV